MADTYDDYTREELIRLLRERDRKPRFGLVWERDEIDHDRSVNGDFVALDLDPVLSCGPAPHQNLLIEGDNFDALRYLRMTHGGKVKCIYIDPPYNTGNRDFIYNDRFVDKDDLYKHSKWLEYMYRRLTLARDLLTSDGVIFVSIGEEECAHLALLMDEVFGGMKVGTLIWQTRQSSDNRNQNGLSCDHEYVLCYGARLKGTPIDIEKFSNPDNDPRGPWRSADMTGLLPKEQRPNCHYDLENPETGVVYPCPPKGWRYERKTMERLIEEDSILWPSKPNGRPRHKKFADNLGSKFKNFSSLMNAPFTSDGGRELSIMGLANQFTFPKPAGLISILLDQVMGPDDVVVDFFAGSATTGHAVLTLNAQDGGNRRFILVSTTEATQSEPDKNICRDVAQKRLKAAVEGYTYHTKGGVKAVEGLGGGFAYARARRIPLDAVLGELAHARIWGALSLMHGGVLDAYDDAAAVQVLDTGRERVAYLARVDEGALEALNAALEGHAGAAVVYSWQAALVAQHIAGAQVSCLPIPRTLVERFGAGLGG